MFNKKKPNPSQTIQKLIVGVFEIRLSQDKLEIETCDKSWKQVYQAPTRPYCELTSLIAAKYKHHMAKDKENEQAVTDTIFNLLYALYGTTLFFYEPALCNVFIALCNEASAKMQAKDATEVPQVTEVPSVPDLKDDKVI